MSGADNRIWIIITAVAAIALVALGYVLGVSPKLAEMSAASEQKQQVDALNAGYEAQLARLAADFENLPEIQRDLEEAQAQLPPNASYPAFLTELNEIAGEHSVEVTNLTFTGSSVLAAGGAEAAEPDATTGAPTGSTVAISTSITLTGSFDDLKDAASSLQKGTRLFLVSALNFTTAGGGAEVAATDSLVINGLLYVLTDGTTLVIDTEAAPVITPTPTETAAP